MVCLADGMFLDMHGQHATTESTQNTITCRKIGPSVGREVKYGLGHEVVWFLGVEQYQLV
jgi:hypothetical protein